MWTVNHPILVEILTATPHKYKIDLVKLLWLYVRLNNLQQCNEIILDDKLKLIFQKEKMSYDDMMSEFKLFFIVKYTLCIKFRSV